MTYFAHFHYIGVRTAIEIKGVLQFTIELNGRHGPPHRLAAQSLNRELCNTLL